ncbi:hypothetical protein KTAU_08810 [Thermogemmatispora aurantia]|uniref:Uncharacterized protein n=1 Tax=Thermogemmatispora aurantia TaxID=2045279 RepID=A0A5J4K423_9CHLR|nr:hypothetical protein KTAU_08810 [Thermogemmatispora aurantia]
MSYESRAARVHRPPKADVAHRSEEWVDRDFACRLMTHFLTLEEDSLLTGEQVRSRPSGY